MLEQCVQKGVGFSADPRGTSVQSKTGHPQREGRAGRAGGRGRDGSPRKVSSACSYFLRKTGRMRMGERQRRLRESERHKPAAQESGRSSGLGKQGRSARRH